MSSIKSNTPAKNVTTSRDPNQENTFSCMNVLRQVCGCCLPSPSTEYAMVEQRERDMLVAHDAHLQIRPLAEREWNMFCFLQTIVPLSIDRLWYFIATLKKLQGSTEYCQEVLSIVAQQVQSSEDIEGSILMYLRAIIEQGATTSTSAKDAVDSATSQLKNAEKTPVSSSGKAER